MVRKMIGELEIIPIKNWTKNTELIDFIENLINIFFIIGLRYKTTRTSGLIQKIISFLYLISVYLIVLWIYIYLHRKTVDVIAVVEYFFLVILIPIKGVDLKKLFDKISDLDIVLKIPKSRLKLMRAALLIGSIGSIAFRVLKDQSFHGHYSSFFAYTISLCYLYVLDFYRVWRLIYMLIVKYRLKTLLKRIESSSKTDIYLFSPNKHILEESKIRVCLKIYKDVIEISEIINGEIFPTILFGVATILPKCLSSFYKILVVIKLQRNLVEVIPVIINLTHIFAYTFTPCIIAEMQIAEVEKIKEILAKKKAVETDKKVLEDIDIFLRYLQVKNFKYKLWRLIALDMSLPLDLINLCTSYVIVMINFAFDI